MRKLVLMFVVLSVAACSNPVALDEPIVPTPNGIVPTPNGIVPTPNG